MAVSWTVPPVLPNLSIYISEFFRRWLYCHWNSPPLWCQSGNKSQNELAGQKQDHLPLYGSPQSETPSLNKALGMGFLPNVTPNLRPLCYLTAYIWNIGNLLQNVAHLSACNHLTTFVLIPMLPMHLINNIGIRVLRTMVLQYFT